MKNNIAVSFLLSDIIPLIDKEKYNTIVFNNVSQLKKVIKDYDIAIFDLKQRFDKGTAFKELKKINENLKILGNTTINKSRIAAKVLKFGLDDFFIFDKKNPNLINEKLEKLLKKNSKQTGIIPINILLNSDKKLKNNLESLVKISNTNIPILIQGEYGCEQELYAKAIHNMSGKKDKQFIPIFCPNLTKEYFENIFISDSNVNTSKSDKNNKSKNSTINNFNNIIGETIFLENIEMLSIELQEFLIKMLENVNYDDDKNNIRIIASSNKNLENEIKNGNFMGELFYMLNPHIITISPLREMRNIIPILVKNLYQYFSLKENKNIEGISNKALKMLENYDWPGNIKEIKTLIYKAVILNKSGILNEKDFSSLISKKNIDGENNIISLIDKNGQYKSMETLKREIVDKYLIIFNSNISEISKVLNVGRATIYRKMESN